MFNFAEITDYIALYAAVLSTLIFIWEMYKHFTKGPRLRVEVSKDQLIIPDPAHEGKKWVSVSVTNVGDQPATITSLGCCLYKNKFDLFRKKAEACYVFPNPRLAKEMPVFLSPGEEWRPLVAQENDAQGIDLGEIAKQKIVQIQIGVSHKRKSICQRLR